MSAPGPDFRPPDVPPPDAPPAELTLTPPTPSVAEDDVVNEERPHPLTPIVQVWVWIVGLVVVFGRQFLENPTGFPQPQLTEIPWFAVGLLAIAVLTIIGNLWTWWTTRFVVTASELRVEHRGVQYESKRIAYRRIQSVDLTQPFAARLLGLAQLTIDVGGQGNIKLQYLSRTRAAQLRDYLVERAASLTAGPAPDPTSAPPPSAWDDTGVRDRVLLRIPARELIVGALLSHDLLFLVLAAAIPLAIGVAANQPLLIGGGIIPILLAIASFLSRRVAGQYRYTLADTPGGLRITRGLTSLSSGTVPVHRIQAVRISEPVLWRRIGRARVDLSFLGLRLTTDEDQAGASSLLLPIGDAAAVGVALHAIWPGFDVDAVPLTPAPPQSKWVEPLGYRWLSYGHDERCVVIRHGWWTRTTWIVPHARVQSAAIHQGWYLRRCGLARVGVHVAGLAGPTVLLAPPEARSWVFAEVDRARAARHPVPSSAPTPPLTEGPDPTPVGSEGDSLG